MEESRIRKGGFRAFEASRSTLEILYTHPSCDRCPRRRSLSGEHWWQFRATRRLKKKIHDHVHIFSRDWVIRYTGARWFSSGGFREVGMLSLLTRPSFGKAGSICCASRAGKETISVGLSAILLGSFTPEIRIAEPLDQRVPNSDRALQRVGCFFV